MKKTGLYQGNKEEKERKRTRKKNNSCTLSFYNGYFSLWPKKLSDAKGPFGDKAFKNLARHIRQTRKNEPEPRRIDFKGEEGDV